ncbi:tRNA glutamyl-Q(34) synthetase GluQRS [Alteromonas sp. 345S023]|uniref:tRNA glutamyl-Q(34) synthetase GluQRS n=1 Tax=Alteromonas profundi TaxID=2696062 RepID=A0A7X5LNL6_9ALTE|nr:tRNA glutamyl-Q(34) synthetase GluQRS [Alteromonas profundi]NDV92239.1 tRNA glutamyl-Q(34) synthetase GluQRS [Alteromonas profundi]
MKSPIDPTSSYVGRFAPSPSGLLHFGSLVTALASYLDARGRNGRWLVRMEDIDAPRCVAGADSEILRTLEAHGLNWDGAVLYQSQHHERYQHKIDQLFEDNRAYYCECTRKQIKAMGGRYDGRCRALALPPSKECAVRLVLAQPLTGFKDGIMGQVSPTTTTPEDVVIKRRDGLYSYNLVVALDDAYQGVTHIVRGSDLLDVTPLHRLVYRTLACSPIDYCHIPVAAVAPGRKLSKQNHAKPIDNKMVMSNLLRALDFLGMGSVISLIQGDYDSHESLLSAAVNEWDRKLVPNTAEIIVHRNESTYYSEPL